MHIPPGFNTVAPYIFVNDASACVDFLVNGLGGTEILRHLDGSRIANAQVRIGTSTIMVSDASQSFPPMPASYYLYVENADEAMRRALSAGAHQIRRARRNGSGTCRRRSSNSGGLRHALWRSARRSTRPQRQYLVAVSAAGSRRLLDLPGFCQ